MDKLKAWMQVCPQYGPSITNVAEQYKRYAPDFVEWVDDWLDADLCIDHLIGTPDRENLVNPLERSYSEDVKCRLELAKMGELKVAYVMHCAIVPDDFYLDALDESVVSTGFIDVSSMLHEDTGWNDDHTREMTRLASKWLRVAWGVDPEHFLLPSRKEDPEYTIYTWGCSADPEEEYIKTIYDAVKLAGGKMLHSGIDYGFNGKHYRYLPPAKTKREVAYRYNQCWFANAMRREDGFELANVEAPLANAWPITLERSCYRYFFEDLSFLVEEDEDMVDSLAEIFSRNWDKDSKLWLGSKEDSRLFHKISPEHKKLILEKFNWRLAVTPFWERIISER